MDTTTPEIDHICAIPKDAGNGRMDVEICYVTRRAVPSQVEYGPTAEYGSKTPPTADMWSNHRVTISGLPIDLPLHFRIRADVEGEGAPLLSPDQTVRYQPEAPPSGAVERAQVPLSVSNTCGHPLEG